jgi:hypothetical protein
MLPSCAWQIASAYVSDREASFPVSVLLDYKPFHYLYEVLPTSAH